MTVFTSIIIGCWIAFILVWAISAFSVKRDINGKWMGWWINGWWVRITIVVVIIIVVHFFSPDSFGGQHIGPLSQNWSTTNNMLLAVLGSILCIGGIALAIWARLHLGRNWSSHPTLKENHELVTSGPYRLIRHPIYTGVIVATLGTGLVTWPWIFVFIGACIMFIWRVKAEEKLMLKQFPTQYPEYVQRTWALIPFIY